MSCVARKLTFVGEQLMLSNVSVKAFMNVYERCQSHRVYRRLTRMCYFVRSVLNNDARQPLKHDVRNRSFYLQAC
jgi:hypothetical protein